MQHSRRSCKYMQCFTKAECLLIWNHKLSSMNIFLITFSNIYLEIQRENKSVTEIIIIVEKEINNPENET